MRQAILLSQKCEEVHRKRMQEEKDRLEAEADKEFELVKQMSIRESKKQEKSKIDKEAIAEVVDEKKSLISAQ